jgi:hypothetical protein
MSLKTGIEALDNKEDIKISLQDKNDEFDCPEWRAVEHLSNF